MKIKKTFPNTGKVFYDCYSVNDNYIRLIVPEITDITSNN